MTGAFRCITRAGCIRSMSMRFGGDPGLSRSRNGGPRLVARRVGGEGDAGSTGVLSLSDSPAIPIRIPIHSLVAGLDAASSHRVAVAQRGAGASSLKIWIDLANSPQVLFFRPIIDEMKRRGHELFITSRPFAQTTQLADQARNSTHAGRKTGGKKTAAIALQVLERSWTLARLARRNHCDMPSATTRTRRRWPRPRSGCRSSR